MPDTFQPDVLANEPSESSSSDSSDQTPDASSEASSRSSESQNQNGDADKKSGQKHPGAYERAKARVAAQQAALAQQETQLRAREAALAQREAAMKPQPKKRDYTLADLRKYHKQWADVGHRAYDPELAEKAEAEIAAMEAEREAQLGTGSPDFRVPLPAAGSPEHTAQWHQAEQELVQADPEFMRNGTKLDARLREIMGSSDGDIYRQHPRGIVAAYHKAKMDLLQADNGELTAKVQDLEKELKRYHGLTGVGSGVSRRPGVDGIKVESPADFAKLSTVQMKKYLLTNAGRGGGAPLF
jgi:hypothetical protein